MLRIGKPGRVNVVDIYDDRAAAWWDFSDPIFEPLHALLPARAAYLDASGIDVAGKVVVDVGAGGGYVAGLVASRGASVFAVDVARRAVLAGKAHNTTTSIACAEASALALPLRDESVDVVVCTDVLVHLPRALGGPAAAVREAARVLRPGGVFWFSTINDTLLARLVLITLGEDVLRVIHKGTHDPDTFLSPTTMKALLDDVGLDYRGGSGFGPVGVTKKMTLKMGRLPTMQGMWQGHATKRRTPLAPTSTSSSAASTAPSAARATRSSTAQTAASSSTPPPPSTARSSTSTARRCSSSTASNCGWSR